MTTEDSPSIYSDEVLSPEGAPSLKAKGGFARAEKLSPEKRSAIAKQAANARWSSGVDRKIIPATHTGELPLGNIILQCAVLEDGTRVVSRNAIFRAFGRTKRGRGRTENRVPNMPSFLDAKNLQPFVIKHIGGGPKQIEYYDLKGKATEGYDALLIPQLCDVYLDARLNDKLTKSQEPLAKAAEVLARSLSKVGIIALVDEATGHQDDRAKNALAKILEDFIAKELREYASTFPLDYYKELFRLRQIPFGETVKRPKYIGHLTNDLVYRRLAPGVLEELRAKNPVIMEKGRRGAHHHQWLTHDKGVGKLLQHLSALVALMRISDSWDQFKIVVDKALPRYKALPLFDQMND